MKATPESSQSALEGQQQFNGSQPQVGRVDADTEPERPVDTALDPTAGDVVSLGGSRLEDSLAAQNVRGATTEISEHNSPTWLLGIFVAGLGFGVVMALRAWADRRLVPAESRKERQDIRW